MMFWVLVLRAAIAQDPSDTGPQLNAQLFRPSVDARYTLWTDDAGVAPDGAWRGRVAIGYANAPLVLESVTTGEVTRLVRDVVQLNAIGSYTWTWLRTAVDVPVVLLATSDTSAPVTGLGDVALDVKGTILNPDEALVGLALSTRVSVPTSTVDLQLGADGLTYEVGAIVEQPLGPLRFALNGGFRGVPDATFDNITVGDQVFMRFGTGLLFSETAGMSLDLAGHTNTSESFENVANAPLEGLLGFWARMGGPFVLRGGVGTGLSEGIGAPRGRAVLMAGYEPARIRDRDGDGLFDDVDACPDQPEDMDGFEDDDGCPESKSPVVFVIRDPYGDLVRGVAVEVTGQGMQDTGGAEFMLPLEPGVYTMIAEATGFAQLTDRFTVLDGEALEVIKAMTPKAPAPRVRVTAEQIKITEKIFFGTASAKIRSSSNGLLEEIAMTMKRHPEILRIRIEGHTDSRGEEKYNLALSARRAESVRNYLVRLGVDSKRLTSSGLGESRPVDDRETQGAWERNRRVEFMILERAR